MNEEHAATCEVLLALLADGYTVTDLRYDGAYHITIHSTQSGTCSGLGDTLLNAILAVGLWLPPEVGE